ncbi:MAG: glycosyltransferase family 39 protein [Candidatus Caenarcaniphilales bacterium]|nr:glycosyltransferase family 39 protein [Candidatus Caenarcaniphilales bacterium]
MMKAGALIKPDLFQKPLILISLWTFVYLTNLGGYSLFDLDEALYAALGKGIYLSDQWLIPTFNLNLPFLEKPPLLIWLIVISYKVFGQNELAARLPSALAVLVTAFLLYLWIGNKKRGFEASLIFLSSGLIWFVGRSALMDALLTMCISGLSLALLNLRKPYAHLSAGLFAGLGLLTKGPVAILLPGIVWMIYASYRPSEWKKLKLPGLLLTALLSALIALPWYFMIYQATSGEFLKEFFLKHNLMRFGGNLGHNAPWFYYLPVLLIGFLPWAVPLFMAFFSAETKRLKRNSTFIYGLIWSVVIVLFFSFSSTKLVAFILPAFPALAITSAEIFHSTKLRSR